MPSTMKQWTVADTNGFDGLKLATDAPIPQIGEKDVLVKCKSYYMSTQNTQEPKSDANNSQSTAPP